MLEEILTILYRPIIDRVAAAQQSITQQIGVIMADAAALQQAVTDLKTSLGTALDRVAEDVAHLREAQGVDPAALDPIITQINDAKASLDALDPDPDFPAAPPTE